MNFSLRDGGSFTMLDVFVVLRSITLFLLSLFFSQWAYCYGCIYGCIVRMCCTCGMQHRCYDGRHSEGTVPRNGFSNRHSVCSCAGSFGGLSSAHHSAIHSFGDDLPKLAVSEVPLTTRLGGRVTRLETQEGQETRVLGLTHHTRTRSAECERK